MKITRRQLRKLIVESGDQEKSPSQKLAGLIIANGSVNQAEDIALALEPPIDIFEVFASNYKAVNTVLLPHINDQKIDNYLYQVADNSFYEMGFFNALFYVLPNFPELSFGMSVEEIKNLINNDPEIFEIYLDADMALGMTWSTAVADGRSMRAAVKEWLAAIAFLKIERMYKSGNKGTLSNIINSVMKAS